MPIHDKASVGGASVFVHGGSDRGLVEVISGGSNVLAFSGPAGSGKSEISAMLTGRRGNRYVFANKESVREPTDLEKAGMLSYTQIQLEDIVRLKEPYLCSTNVDLSIEAQMRWQYWISRMKLERKGLFAPEPELAGELVGEFTNVYRLNTVLDQQCKTASDGRVLVFEICPDIEKILAQLFPEMKVVRLYTSREERVRRLLQRHHPVTEREWAITSLKILNSISTQQHRAWYTRVCRAVENETMEHAKSNASLAGRLIRSKVNAQVPNSRVNLALSLAL